MQKSRFGSHLEVAREPGESDSGLLSNFKMAAEPTFSNLLFHHKPVVCDKNVTYCLCREVQAFDYPLGS